MSLDTFVNLVILCVTLHCTSLTFFDEWAVGTFTELSACCGFDDWFISSDSLSVGKGVSDPCASKLSDCKSTLEKAVSRVL